MHFDTQHYKKIIERLWVLTKNMAFSRLVRAGGVREGGYLRRSQEARGEHGLQQDVQAGRGGSEGRVPRQAVRGEWAILPFLGGECALHGCTYAIPKSENIKTVQKAKM